jgi:hypothetical protein
MKVLFKRVLALIAIKEAIEKLIEWRRPERSSKGRVATGLGVLGALGGGAYYLASTNRLRPAIARAKSALGLSEDDRRADYGTSSPPYSAASNPPATGATPGVTAG